MKINNIKVSAGRTFNHPFESYSNLRCDVHLDAQLDDGEDPKASMQSLQAQAEEFVEGHKQDLLKQLHNLERLTTARREISELERRMQDAADRLKGLRGDVALLEEPRAEHFENDGEDEVTF